MIMKKLLNKLTSFFSLGIFKSFGNLFPDLQNRIPITSRLHGGSTSRSTLLESNLYQRSGWTFKAVSIWANTIAPLPLRVFDDEGNIVSHAVLDDLLSHPNPDFSSNELWKTWATELGVTGECGFEVIYNGNQPIELWPHDTSTVIVRPDDDARIYSRVAGYRIYQPSVADYLLDTNEFIHWKFFNKLNRYRGISLIAALRYAVSSEVFAQKWTDAFFQNGARPDYAVIAPSGLTKTERKKYEAEVTSEFGLTGGTYGYGKPIVLESGVTDIKPLNFSPKDMEWLNLRKMNREEIGSVYGIPRELMFSENSKYDNLDLAEQLFWTITILPLLSFRDSKLTHFFHENRILEKNLQIKTDVKNVIPLRRVLTPMIRQARAFHSMGVPFNLVNDYFEFGFPRYDADDVSAPFGTPQAFNEEGQLIDNENSEV